MKNFFLFLSRKISFASQRKRDSVQSGVSLIIVLIMLGVIALTSAATLRNASSNERVSNNFRMQVLAQEYAEAALRYCESQLTLADATRVDALKESNLLAVSGSTTPAFFVKYKSQRIGARFNRRQRVFEIRGAAYLDPNHESSS